MENKKGNNKPGSSSSITSQLFGSQESSSPNDVLASIFPPPKGIGRNSEVRGPWHKETSRTENLNAKQENTYKQGDKNNGKNSSIYQQQGVEPCHLSSSIYYGSRDMYSTPSTQSTSTSYPTFKKDDEGEDDPSGVARGNWWQGSLYY